MQPMSEPMPSARARTGPEVEAWVRNFVVESFLSAAEAETFRNDDDLLTTLDSLQVLRIVVALEPAFGLKVGNDDLTADNLGSVERIAAFIARKEGERSMPPATTPTGI